MEIKENSVNSSMFTNFDFKVTSCFTKILIQMKKRNKSAGKINDYGGFKY